MRKLKTYLPSIICAALLVFSFIAVSLVISFRNTVNEANFVRIYDENNLSDTVRKDLSGKFEDNYNTTGIPADIFNKALTGSYIDECAKLYIRSAFDTLSGGAAAEVTLPENSALEKDLTDFLNSYADSIGYEKNDRYYERLDATISSAYGTIGNSCDVYKTKLLSGEGLLTSASRIYGRMNLLTIATVCLCLILVLIIAVINRKNISESLYWYASSMLVSGLISLIPCMILRFSRYFDRFTIKLPQVYTAITGVLYDFVDRMLVFQLFLIAGSVVVLAIYFVIDKMLRRKSRIDTKADGGEEK